MIPRHVQAKAMRAAPRPVRPGGGRMTDRGYVSLSGMVLPSGQHRTMCRCFRCEQSVIATPDETDPSNGPRK